MNSGLIFAIIEYGVDRMATKTGVMKMSKENSKACTCEAHETGNS